MSDPSRTRPAASRVGKPDRLTRRADYVATAKGRRFHSASLSLQAAERPSGEGAGGPARARFGLTVSRKVGKAVVRNRVKRRLRAAIALVEAAREQGSAPLPGPHATSDRLLLPEGLPAPDHDYVVVARTEALARPFAALVLELATDIAGVHQARRAARATTSGTGHVPRSHRTRGKGPSSSETR